MPDITMCPGETCSKKYQCYRFSATPDEKQSYFAEVPVDWNGKCEYFMQVDRSIDLRKQFNEHLKEIGSSLKVGE